MIIVEKIIYLDNLLTELIFTLPSNTFTISVMRFFSVEGIFAFGWLLILLFVYKTRLTTHRKSHLFFEILTVLLIANALVNVAIKPFFARPRPHATIKQVANNRTFVDKLFSIPVLTNKKPLPSSPYPTDHSFPSGHATLAFALATVLSMRDRKLRWLYFLVTSLVAFSRVYLGYHYFLDVVAGGMIGWITTHVLIKVNKKA